MNFKRNKWGSNKGENLLEDMIKIFQNETNKSICHAKQPNSQCSSVAKIHQLQEEIKSLREKLEEMNSEFAYSIIYNINYCDRNIIKRSNFPLASIHNQTSIEKEIKNRWIDFIELFNFVEDDSKDKMINYLKNHKDLKQKTEDHYERIENLKNQIKTEKKKLGIE